jgi:hypothetical protein
MQRVRVSSSNIASIGWEPSRMGLAGRPCANESGTLEIEFHRGDVYQYSRVPEAVYQAFLRAPSKGRYFHGHIKDRYLYREVA